MAQTNRPPPFDGDDHSESLSALQRPVTADTDKSVFLREVESLKSVNETSTDLKQSPDYSPHSNFIPASTSPHNNPLRILQLDQLSFATQSTPSLHQANLETHHPSRSPHPAAEEYPLDVNPSQAHSSSSIVRLSTESIRKGDEKAKLRKLADGYKTLPLQSYKGSLGCLFGEKGKIETAVASKYATFHRTSSPITRQVIGSLFQLDADKLDPSQKALGADSTNPRQQSEFCLFSQSLPAPTYQWSYPTSQGLTGKPNGLRSHALCAVDATLFVFGGCSDKESFNELHLFNTGQLFTLKWDPSPLVLETLLWYQKEVSGDKPSPRRAMSMTALSDKKLILFGGGDHHSYFNDLYLFDTVLFKWKALAPEGVPPSERRSHSAAWWDKRKTLVIFGGGNGERALNDLYFLEFTVSGCHWRAVTTTGALPPPRGYHSSVIFKDKLFVYGGSDGRHSFSDLNILYLDSLEWIIVDLCVPEPAFSYYGLSAEDLGALSLERDSDKRMLMLPRFGHSAVVIGEYMCVQGGHNSDRYVMTTLFLNLETLTWDLSRHVMPVQLPASRGYHGCAYQDGRLFVYGGFDGDRIYDDLWILELGTSAYITASDYEKRPAAAIITTRLQTPTRDPSTSNTVMSEMNENATLSNTQITSQSSNSSSRQSILPRMTSFNTYASAVLRKSRSKTMGSTPSTEFRTAVLKKSASMVQSLPATSYLEVVEDPLENKIKE